MIKRMYSVYDTVSEIFFAPMIEVNDASAIRSFERSIKVEGVNKLDYELYYIAEFNDNNGEFEETVKRKIYSGFEMKLESENIETTEILKEVV